MKENMICKTCGGNADTCECSIIHEGDFVVLKPGLIKEDIWLTEFKIKDIMREQPLQVSLIRYNSLLKLRHKNNELSLWYLMDNFKKVESP